MYEIDAVILAGGRSRRMGRDKALLPFGGSATLAEYQYRRLRPLFHRVWLSAKEAKFPFDAPLIPDEHPESSPMVALASILRQAPGEGIFLLGVDMPFVSEELIRKILDEAARHPESPLVAVTSPRGVEPLCALYRRDLLPIVEKQLEAGNHRLRSLPEMTEARFVDAEDPEELANLNHPEEYARALSAER
jgi:molybdopterin-guanine dinucleotide biosynthesis protein A